jgi:hypothetical protein
MVFRCNPDVTEIEVLGNNFRNNYEVAVDSYWYGTMWQYNPTMTTMETNKGVRINILSALSTHERADRKSVIISHKISILGYTDFEILGCTTYERVALYVASVM